MKILPCVSAGIVLLHEDRRTHEMAPLQVFRLKSGMTVIRIGHNALFFREDGTFDGTECALRGDVPDEEKDAVVRAFQQSAGNRGKIPDGAYFAEGTAGHAAETRGWPDREEH